jgi:FAD/FMN-containing dehydrogenase
MRKQKISGWANYPTRMAEVYSPETYGAAAELVLAKGQLIARGNGKSYGDASLGSCVLCTQKFNKILDFNADTGVITCQSGVLLSDILPLIIPKGWFFQVTPGIKSITVGGAVASDVHGKNHPHKGCFSNHLLSFELLDALGNAKVCSRVENSDLFWQTCGGMGWTGIILSVTFQLMRVKSVNMRQETIQCRDFDALFQAFEENKTSAYAAGWIDTTATGKNFGRGAVHLAEHQETNETLRWAEKSPTNIPFNAPFGLLNPLTIRAFNEFYFRKNKSQTQITSIDSYFYPLDALSNWNRLYGSRGLVQYQFCLPEEVAQSGIKSAMETIRKSGDRPFLSVLKRHGERPIEAINSFPIKGYSLALDFPRTQSIFSLVNKLDELVWAAGGKIYLTKDACSAPKMGRIDSGVFKEKKFYSDLRARLEQTEPK